MAQRVVKIKGYTVEVELDNGTTNRTMARRGETVEISEEEAERGDALGYFLSGDEPEGPAVEPDSAAVVDMSDDELDAWIESGVNVKEVVGAAADAEDAERILGAENRVATANGRDARVGIEKGLAAVIGASE